MKVNKYLLPVLAIVLLLGTVWVAKAAGLWTTSGRGQVMLDEEGRPDPQGIKGWMTLQDVSETYGVPLDDLYALLGLPDEIGPDTAMKELEHLVPGFSMATVRDLVAAYLAGEVPARPKPPEPQPTATPEPPAEHTPAGPAAERTPGQGDGTGEDRPPSTSLPAGQVLPAAEIKGRMTLREVSDLCGVPLDYLYEQMNLPADADPDLRMRDLRDTYDFEVEVLREVVRVYQEENL